MANAYSNFYRNFYLRTGGYFPSWPLNQNVYPGDFFQIRNGEMIFLGNVFRKGLVDPIEHPIEYGVKLNPLTWTFFDGISKPYAGRGTGKSAVDGSFEFSRQMLSFQQRGSFYFKASDPESIRIGNWNNTLQQQLIIKLTQTYYSFRELYLVTETVVPEHWTLAIAGAANAELEIATDAENFGLVDLFGYSEARTIQSREMEYYHREEKRKPCFFSAKKLAVQDEKLSTFTNELILEREGLSHWAASFFGHDYYHDHRYMTPASRNAQISTIDMLSANELNPNTALLYFKWAEATLDDVEKLFMSYED